MGHLVEGQLSPVLWWAAARVCHLGPARQNPPDIPLDPVSSQCSAFNLAQTYESRLHCCSTAYCQMVHLLYPREGRCSKQLSRFFTVIQDVHWDEVFTESMPAHNLSLLSPESFPYWPPQRPQSLHEFPGMVRNDNLSKQKTKVGKQLFSVFKSGMMKSAGPHVVH